METDAKNTFVKPDGFTETNFFLEISRLEYFKKSAMYKSNIMSDMSGRVVARLIMILAAAGMAAAPMEALAHARMIRSSPTADGVTQSPAQVELWFNELLDDRFNTIIVYPAAEANTQRHPILTKGDVKVDPKDKTHLTIEVKPLPPGEYMAEWRVLSLDGHSAPGRFKFRVLAAKQ
jgi:methionine-rich copper-binding protein CopC